MVKTSCNYLLQSCTSSSSVLIDLDWSSRSTSATKIGNEGSSCENSWVILLISIINNLIVIFGWSIRWTIYWNQGNKIFVCITIWIGLNSWPCRKGPWRKLRSAADSWSVWIDIIQTNRWSWLRCVKSLRYIGWPNSIGQSTCWAYSYEKTGYMKYYIVLEYIYT